LNYAAQSMGIVKVLECTRHNLMKRKNGFPANDNPHKRFLLKKHVFPNDIYKQIILKLIIIRFIGYTFPV
jgi:hypothetical protein